MSYYWGAGWRSLGTLMLIRSTDLFDKAPGSVEVDKAVIQYCSPGWGEVSLQIFPRGGGGTGRRLCSGRK